jgi:hypothetical protein
VEVLFIFQCREGTTRAEYCSIAELEKRNGRSGRLKQLGFMEHGTREE